MTAFWQAIIFVAFLVIILAATAATMAAVARWQRKRLQKLVMLTITNDGNVRSRYDLRAESSSGALSFRYSADGEALPPAFAAAQPPGQATAAPTAQAPQSGAAGMAAAQMSPSQPPQPSGPPLPGLVAELLVTVGYILPGSLGQSLTRAGSQIRYGQSVADKASKVGGRVAGVAGSAARTSQQIAGTVSGSQPGQSAGQATSAPAEPVIPAEVWWRTAYVEPGESTAVTVAIGPGAASPGEAETYRLVTRSAELADAPVVAADGVARLDGAGGLARWLPYVGILGLAVVVALGALGFVQTVFPVR